MMNKRFTDLFIQRPVLAVVISLLILVLGLRAIFNLQVRQFPKLQNTVITVTTTYGGAPAQLIQGFITDPLEKQMAGAEGIDYMTSQSTDGVSIIKAYIKLNFDPNIAFTNVLSKVQEASGSLPKEADNPVIEKETGSSISLMYISFNSTKMSRQQITDYVSRVIQPKLETVNGVAEAQILGGQTFAMRVWLNPQRMAALGATPNDIYEALSKNNVQAAAGKTKGNYIEIPINPQTDLHTIDEFKGIVIKYKKGGGLVRLGDLSKIELGAENYDSSVYFNGKQAVFVGITTTPNANALDVIAHVKKLIPEVQGTFPPTLQSKIVYDATKYIRSSINEVIKTILEATVIVIIVIFLFLGSLRTVLIPVITIPLSLVGVCALMLALGYSFNLLTLLAMVLAIGMVVDDAIVVVENIYRHIEEGSSPREAALQGAREIALPIISMTLTLAAVYAPIGFMSGLTGALFKEFAFTLAAAVIISGVIALTLSPMMCSRLLSSEIGKHRLVHFVDQQFDRLRLNYHRVLSNAIANKPVIVIFALIVLVSCVFLYTSSKKELAPVEDQGAVFVFAQGPQTASLNYMETYTKQFDSIFKNQPATEDYFVVNGLGTISTAIAGVILKPWDERTQSQAHVLKALQPKLNQVAGVQGKVVPLPSLPTTGSSIPIQFVILSTRPFNAIYSAMQELVNAAQQSGLFIFVRGDLDFDKPQLDVGIRYTKAAEMGVTNQQIATALSTMFGSNYVNRFNLSGRSYKVIPQIQQRFRITPDAVKHVYIRTASGQLIPLSTIVTLSYSVQPSSLNHFQQLNAATIEGVMHPGYTLAQGLTFLKAQAKKRLPGDMTYDYAGQSRQYMQEGSALMITFGFAIIVIFLVLAAQFESFRHPLVIMISVPMAICGALLPLSWGLASINIYTQIGLITLIGLIAKHGILMVEFANKRLEAGETSPALAIAEAASIRLRPVLMTTFSMVFGVVPLILATGAGAVSRFDMGLVVASGMLIGTLFTLFVVPIMYLLRPSRILLFLGVAAVLGALVYVI